MNELAAARVIVGVPLLIAGVIFCALGVLGVFRMPDVFTRIHSGSKAVTLGAPMALLGAAFLSPLEVSLKAIAVTLFLYLTVPIGTFATARAAHRRREPMTDLTVTDELERDRKKRPLTGAWPTHLD